MELDCKKFCCTRRFIPLQCSFATTTHRVQDSSIGPTKPGQPPNTIQKMVFDPGDKKFESQCPATFYTGLPRATTMGNGDPYKSAILFTGKNICSHRLLNMTKYSNDSRKTLQGIQQRQRWVSYLLENRREHNLTKERITFLLSWSMAIKLSKEEQIAIRNRRPL